MDNKVPEGWKTVRECSLGKPRSLAPVISNWHNYFYGGEGRVEGLPREFNEGEDEPVPKDGRKTEKEMKKVNTHMELLRQHLH